jgi:hypothetical protein
VYSSASPNTPTWVLSGWRHALCKKSAARKVETPRTTSTSFQVARPRVMTACDSGAAVVAVTLVEAPCPSASVPVGEPAPNGGAVAGERSRACAGVGVSGAKNWLTFPRGGEVAGNRAQSRGAATLARH